MLTQPINRLDPTLRRFGFCVGMVSHLPLDFHLSTGRKSQSPEEILEFVGEVEDDVTKEIEAVAEKGLERSLKGFF